MSFVSSALRRLNLKTEGRSVCLLFLPSVPRPSLSLAASPPALVPSITSASTVMADSPRAPRGGCRFTTLALMLGCHSLSPFISHAHVSFANRWYKTKTAWGKASKKPPLIGWRAAALWEHYGLAVTMGEKLTGVCSKFCCRLKLFGWFSSAAGRDVYQPLICLNLAKHELDAQSFWTNK